MKRHTYTTAYKEESRLFFGALACVVVAVVAYMYFVSLSITHVVMRKEVDSHIQEMATSISELEETYIELQHSVSGDIASHNGFAIAEKKIFIDTSAAGDTLVLRN